MKFDAGILKRSLSRGSFAKASLILAAGSFMALGLAEDALGVGGAVAGLLAAAALLLWLRLFALRLANGGWGAWWLGLLAVPVVGWAALAVLLCMPCMPRKALRGADKAQSETAPGKGRARSPHAP
jgi:uncharacterized membrane protein YhaH (DUF805 family)